MRTPRDNLLAAGQAARPVRRGLAILLLLLGPAWAPVLRAQQVVDRIVARIEGDILTLSEMRELGRFQELLGGRAASDAELLRQLIEQWIVNAEATATRYARPSAEEVERANARLEKGFASPEAYRARLRELGLSEPAVRRHLERQLYLSRYIDYKFRPAAQVEAADIEKYYREELVPPLEARQQPVPPLEKVEEQIHELLLQREISRRAAQWLEESRQRLRIEMESGGVSP